MFQNSTMSKSVLARIVGLLILFAATAIGPWFLALFLLLIGVWYFEHFYEAIIPALFFDLVYGGFMASVATILLVALFDGLREYLIMPE